METDKNSCFEEWFNTQPFRLGHFWLSDGVSDGYKDLIKGLTIHLKSKKSTLLDCLNDILHYFQDRLRSKDIRNWPIKTNINKSRSNFIENDSM